MASDIQTSNCSFPLVIPTQSQVPSARLVLKNELGQVVQQWLIRQNKSTLGSSSSCALRCQEPGIAPYHALLVVGARQIFVRALAPKLTRDGVAVNELLLRDEQSHFEIAGYRFELTRAGNAASDAQLRSSGDARLKFTLARPFALNQRRMTTGLPQPPASTHPPSIADDRQWVAKLVQAAIEPLECQIRNVLEPLAELQAETFRQRSLLEQKLTS